MRSEGTMQLIRYPDAVTFALRVGPFLMRHEAAHNLQLGLLEEIRQVPGRYPGQNYYAAVERDGEVLLSALRTPPHPLSLSLTADVAAVALVARDLAGDALAPDAASGPAEVSLAFAEAWRARTGRQFERSMALRIYKLERVQPPVGVAGLVRRAGPADLELLAEWLAGFYADAGVEGDAAAARAAAERWLGSPVRAMYLWEDGCPVSMAGTTGPTPNGMRIGAVYTPRELRGRGYGSAVTAAASQAVLDSGRSFTFLYTDLANPTSNHIYQQIGYQAVCDVDDYHFVQP
jgi:uncharacterized protein